MLLSYKLLIHEVPSLQPFPSPHVVPRSPDQLLLGILLETQMQVPSTSGRPKQNPQFYNSQVIPEDITI